MWKIFLLIALIAVARPSVGVAQADLSCGSCEADLRDLISARLTAIEHAFGDVFGTLASQMRVRVSDPRDSEYGGRAAYDAEVRTLIIPRTYLRAMQASIPLDWASYYWPYYGGTEYQEAFSVIGAIDTLLWDAYLQEAARERGVSWPDEDCFATEIRRRLPCEMLVAGIAAHVRAVRLPMFNANRLDLIWPEDFATFERNVRDTRDSEYIDVQQYGGMLLLQPLIAEFGVPRVLAYAAGTPFELHDDNLRLSALRYQSNARAVLRDANHNPSARNPETQSRSTRH